VIGNGVVVDPSVLFQELESIKKEGFNPDLIISSNAHVIFPFHSFIDGLEESTKKNYAAGTTNRGIGPTYSDKAARWGLRGFDLTDPDIFRPKFTRLFELKKKFVQSMGVEWPFKQEEIEAKYLEFGRLLKPFMKDTEYYINEAIDSGKNVMFEGAQGTLLSLDQGMYPYGTSSLTWAGGISGGTGVSPKKIDTIIGIIKAYTSRVGGGPVPTELTDEIGIKIREQGHEYGTTTGRPRRVGWLDLVNIKYATIINSFDSLCITLLDALSGVDPVKICTKYELNGMESDKWPIQSELISKSKPVYISMQGWKSMQPKEWSEIAKSGYSSLPTSIQKYLEKIEEILKVPINIISIGPNRADTIIKKKIW